MPRQARKKSSSGIYHIMLRGINRQQIFENAEDRGHFLETLENYKVQCGYTVYAYCLMGNHIHLLLKGEHFIDYHLQKNEDVCMEMEERFRLTDEDAKVLINIIAKCKTAAEFQMLDIKTRSLCIHKLHKKTYRSGKSVA